MKHIYLFLSLLTAGLASGMMPCGTAAQTRTETLLEKGWKFTREDAPEFSACAYDDVWIIVGQLKLFNCFLAYNRLMKQYMV